MPATPSSWVRTSGQMWRNKAMLRIADASRNQSFTPGTAGMTLIELLVVVAVLGLLTAIAFPMYQEQMNSARRSDGHSLLLDISARMERYYFDNTTYTTDLTELGFSSSSGVASTEGYYSATVAAGTVGCPIGSCYSVTATPSGAQTGDAYCGNLTLNSQGVKSKSGSGPLDRCW